MSKKILIIITCVLLLFSVFSNCIYAEESVSWFVKKNGNMRPIFTEQQKLIDKYDGYYMDNKVSDDDKNKVLYLTFDAGYENGNVEKILDVLKEKNVPAAFFLLDNIILRNTELVKRMGDEGHLVCNHTKDHKDINKMTIEQISKNLTDLEKIYSQKTGKSMSKYFRFPEGKYSEASLKCIQELGYKSIFWSMAYPDWDNERQIPPEKAKEILISNTHNGAVILLHPTSATNAKILSQLIDTWREMGYDFGTLDNLTA